MEKDYVANLLTIGGITLTIAHIQTTLTVLILATGLVLNIQRIYANWKKKRRDQKDSK